MNHNEASLNREEMAQSAHTRASFGSFLNVHFITLPDLGFIERIRSAGFRATLESLVTDQALPGDLSAGAALMLKFLDENADVEAAELSIVLGKDRTYLYRGVNPKDSPPPPCEAVWSRSRPNVIELLQELTGIYRQSGLALAENAGERLDYIGVEMDYLHRLAEKEAEAWQMGDVEVAGELLKQQEAFHRAHLGEWAPLFVKKALPAAKTDFYRGHLTMLLAWVVGSVE
ncbi:MAG: molecular chaperone TorD family protein [Peptococcaceae bacterium]|nr:molecular chaperone TorD family protein [Peptococcaceae bacterium]